MSQGELESARMETGDARLVTVGPLLQPSSSTVTTSPHRAPRATRTAAKLAQASPLIGFGARHRPRDLRRDRAAARQPMCGRTNDTSGASFASGLAHRLPPRPRASVSTTGPGRIGSILAKGHLDLDSLGARSNLPNTSPLLGIQRFLVRFVEICAPNVRSTLDTLRTVLHEKKIVMVRQVEKHKTSKTLSNVWPYWTVLITPLY
jgi:hypothetical protein